MKCRIHWILCCVCLVLITMQPRAYAEGSVSTPAPPRIPFGPGESFTFSVGYGLINAGETTLTVEPMLNYYGSEVYHVRARARSNRFFSAIFRVRDQVESYIDATELYARYFNKHIREGSFRRDVEIHFDHEQKKAYYPDGRENEIPFGVQDVLSAFYYVRAMELNDGDDFLLPTHGDKALYDLRILVHGREMVDSMLGSKSCIKIEPILDGHDKLFRHEGQLYVWLTDDDDRVPVLLKANIAVGAIEAKLTQYTPPTPIDLSDDSHDGR